MKCLVYRSKRYPDMYVYLDRELDDAELPEDLLTRVGGLEYALTFELTTERRLARADPETVLAAIADQGFYLQMPPRDQFGPG